MGFKYKMNCKPYIIKHRLGGKTDYISFSDKDKYHEFMKTHDMKGWEYYEYCHKFEIMNKFKIYLESCKFPFNLPKGFNYEN